MGDDKQCINQFNGSTTKYFDNHEIYFNNGRPWVERRMITSYRLTPKVAEFIEATFGMNGTRHIVGGNGKSNNERPVYIANSYKTELIEEILMWAIEHYGVDNVGIMIQTVDSIASKSPLDKILNGSNGTSQLTRRGITPVFRGSRDNGGRNKRDQYEAGKLLISTFNSMKGSEKEATFVFLSDYYRKKYDSDAITEIGNIPYVAYTRARELLVIIQGPDEMDGPIQPLRNLQVEQLCAFNHRCTDIPFPKLKKDTSNLFNHKLVFPRSVTDIVTHRSTVDLLQLLSFLKIVKSEPLSPVGVSECIDIEYTYTEKTKVIQGKTPVLKYYGIAITILAEQQRMNGHQVYTSRILTFMKMYYKRRHPGADDTGLIEYYDTRDEICKRSFPEIKESHLLEKDPVKSYELAKILMNKYFKPGVGIRDELLSVIEYDILEKYRSNDTIRLIMTTEMYNERISEYYALRDFKWFRMDVLQKLTDSLNNYLGPQHDELYELPISAELTHPNLKYTRSLTSEYDLGTPTRFYLKPNITPEALRYFSPYQINGDHLTTSEPWKFWYTYINLEGRIDIIKDEIPIEVKCHTLDDNESLLQLATYLAMSPYNTGRLINVVTGTITQLTLTNKIAFLSVLTHAVKNWETITTLELKIEIPNLIPPSSTNPLPKKIPPTPKEAPPIPSVPKTIPSVPKTEPPVPKDEPPIPKEEPSVPKEEPPVPKEDPSIGELITWPKYKLQLYCKELGLKGYAKKDIRVDDLVVLIQNHHLGVGTDPLQNYNTMTTKQLTDLCKQLEIKNYYKLKKQEMIAELLKLQQ